MKPIRLSKVVLFGTAMLLGIVLFGAAMVLNIPAQPAAAADETSVPTVKATFKASGSIQFVDLRKQAGIDFEHFGERHRWCEIGPGQQGISTNEKLEWESSPQGDTKWKSRDDALTPDEFLEKHLVRMNGSGAAWLDYDRDGDWDLYLVNGKGDANVTNALFENKGDGKFEPRGSDSGVLDTGEGMAVSVADFDNDGYPDLFVTNYGGFVLYRNKQDGSFEDVTKAAFSGGVPTRWYGGSAWGDYDRNGDLDLYVAGYVNMASRPKNMNLRFPMDFQGFGNTLYRNNGDGTFLDVTQEAKVGDALRMTMQVLFCDFNEDGWADILVGNDTDPNSLYLNRGDGTFSEFSGPSGLSSTDGTMGIAVGDYNGDLKLDLFFSNFAGEAGILNLCVDTESSNDGKLRNALFFADFDSPDVLKATWPRVGWGNALTDFDNDGDLDLFIASGHLNAVTGDNRQLNLMFVNDGSGKFTNISKPSGVEATGKRIHRAAIVADYDNDGKIDIYVVNNGEMAYKADSDRTGVLYHNESPANANRWLKIRLEGTKSNRDAYGARVMVTSGKSVQMQTLISGTGYFSAHAKELHFGLGQNSSVDKIEVKWPNGQLQVFKQIDANQTVYIIEGGQLHGNTLMVAAR
jgi:hypothetical protein